MISLQFLEKIHILKVLNPQRNTQLRPCSGETRSRNSCAGMLALYLYLLCLSTMWCLLCGCSFWSLTCRSDAEPACIVFPAWRTGTGGSTGDRHTNAPYLHWNHTPVFFFSDSSAHRNFTASYSNETTLCLNSGGQRLWRTNRNLVCVWFSIVDEWNRRKTLLLFSGGEVWKGRAVLKLLLMLHQRWAGESCCTCRRPFVQLSLHSAADALHTLAGVKRCQAHLWPSVKGRVIRVYVYRGEALNSAVSLSVGLGSYTAQLPFNTDTIIIINSHIRALLEMCFLWAKAATEVLDLNESLKQTCLRLSVRVQV